MDTQSCPFILQSYAYTTKDIRLEWHTTPYVKDEDDLPIYGYQLQRIESQKTIKVFGMGTGLDFRHRNEYDRLHLTFIVRRSALFFVYKIYILMFLLIIFSVGTYWVPETALPARMTLIVTTFLSSVFMLQSVSDNHVRTPTTTSLQIFITFSIGMYDSFLSLSL